MTHPAEPPPTKRILAGRAIAGLWAINFLLLITETLTFGGQSQLSVGLAIAAVLLLFQR